MFSEMRSTTDFLFYDSLPLLLASAVLFYRFCWLLLSCSTASAAFYCPVLPLLLPSTVLFYPLPVPHYNQIHTILYLHIALPYPILPYLHPGSLRSPLATCLLVRYTSSLLHEDMSSTNARTSYQFLENCLRHKNEMVRNSIGTIF
jgi:hypothetical protein